MQKRNLNGNARILIALLIVISTALFLIGIAVERTGSESSKHREVVTATESATVLAATPQQSGAAGYSEESREAHANEEKQETGPPHQERGETETAETVHAEDGSETILGIDVENPWIVAAFVTGWLVLLIALFLLERLALILISIAASASVIFDIAEIAHQLSSANRLLAAVAILVAGAHLAIAVLAGMSLMGRIQTKSTNLRAG